MREASRAGMIGGTPARWTGLGHEVFLANSRGTDTLRELAAETGAKAVTVVEGPPRGRGRLLGPRKSSCRPPEGSFANVPNGVVVIDTGNYYPARDGRIELIEGGKLESEWVLERISGRRAPNPRVDERVLAGVTGPAWRTRSPVHGGKRSRRMSSLPRLPPRASGALR